MLIAKLQLGAFSLGANGVFFSNPTDSSSSQRSSIPLKPIFGIALNSITVKTSWVFDARTPKPRFTNALATGSGSLEKGLQFSPTFDDYVKVMESVKTQRSKDSSSDIEGHDLKKGSLGKDASRARDSQGKDKLARLNQRLLRENIDDHGRRRGKNSEDARRLTKSREHDSVEGSASGWGLVEGILEKASAGKSGDLSDGGLKDRRSSSYRKFEDAGKNVDGGYFKKKGERFGKYMKNQNELGQNGRDVQRVSERGIPSERKNPSGYETLGKLEDTRRVESNSRPWVQKSSYDDNSEEFNKRKAEQKEKWVRDRSNSRSEVERRSYGKIGDMKRVGSDFRPPGQESSYDDDSEEFNKRKVEQKGKWGDDRSNSRSEMERRSYGKIGDTTRVGSYSHPLGQRFSYGNNSEEFNKRQVEQKEKWAHDCIDSSTKDTYTYKRRIESKSYEKTGDQMRVGSDSHPRGKKSSYVDSSQEFKRGEAELKGKWVNDKKSEERISPFEQGVHRTRLRVHHVVTKTKDLTSGSIELRGRSGTNGSKTHKFAGRDIDAIDHEDRAAFRTFEVFTDVRNRSRVLRMEMEERIEKLAKWLNATDVNMPEWQFSKMMHSADIKFTDHTILRVVQILGALGNWRRVLQVVEWLHSRERFISYKSRYIYTSVLDVLGKAKRPIEALNIFYAMRKELSSYPDLAAYHCIAVTLGQAGLISELFDVIDCMQAAPEKKFKLGPLQKWDPRLEPDLVIYNAVLNACVQQKQWEGAFWVFQQLKQYGIKPTNTTYGLAMEVMLACGKYNLVHEFFRKVNKTSIPSALNYKVLINTLRREGKIDEAVQAIWDMERRGIVGSASLYYDLARCLCSAGKCQEALQQIDKICRVAKKPLVVTYTGLIQACLDSGSIENGAFIFNQMHKFCSPNNVTVNIMLKAYLEHGMLEEAKELFHKILDGSHDFDSKAALREKVIPDKFMFNVMMEACATANNWDDFVDVYEQMLFHGFHFDTRRHLRMVLDAFRAGKVQVMELTWEHLVRSGRVPPPPIIKERFCMKLEEDDHVAAVSCIGVHQEIEMQAFSERTWLNLIESMSGRLKKNTITRLAGYVSNLVGESDRPHPIFRNLLYACQEFLSFERDSVGVLDEHRSISCELQLKS